MYKKLKVIENDSDDSLREDQVIHIYLSDLNNVEIISPAGTDMGMLCLPDFVNGRVVKEWVLRVAGDSNNVFAIPLAY